MLPLASWWMLRGSNEDEQLGHLPCVQDRESIQESFCTGKTKVVVATVAFGMGVDAQGVRGVIHTTLPRSLEEYVQQVPCHVVTLLLDGCNAIIYYTFLAFVTR